MVLRRLTIGPAGSSIPFDVAVFGTAKGAVAKDLIAALSQAETTITISNKEILESQWPGPPKVGDRFIYDGVTKNVLGVETKYLGADVLVHVCQVKG